MSLRARRRSSAEEQKLRRSYWRDPRQFIERYLRIQTKVDGLIQFKLNLAQQIVYRKIQEHRAAGKPIRFLILKARQLGISTLIQGLLFSQANLNQDNNCLIVSYDHASSKAIYKKACTFLDHLPSDIKPMVSVRTQQMIDFSNPDTERRAENPGLRSTIQIATARNKDVGASMTIHGAHLSELPRWAFPEDSLLSIMNAVPNSPGTMVVIESTAQGAKGLFYDMWKAAVNGESEWTPIFLPWWIFPEYEKQISVDERKALLNSLNEEERHLLREFAPMMTLEKIAWRRWCLDVNCQGDLNKLRQEYPSTDQEAFVFSGTTVFDPAAVQYHLKFARDGRKGRLVRDERTRKAVFIQDPAGPLTVWKPPSRRENYAIGGDPSQGMVKRRDNKKGDYAAACVLSNRMEQVAQLQAHLEPHDFADYLDMLGRWYNTAIINPEVSGYGGGYAVQYALQQTYPNIARHVFYDRVGQKQSEQVGFNPNGSSVPILISKTVREVHRSAGILLPSEMSDKAEDDKPAHTRLSHSQRERQRLNYKLRLYSRELMGEMATFTVHDNGKIGASGGEKDDLVRALGLAILALEQIPPPREFDPLMNTLGKMPAIDYNANGVSSSVSGNSNFPDWI